MVYTVGIGSNWQRTTNMALARRCLLEIFPGIRFSEEVETEPLFFHRPNLFSNQVARFVSPLSAEEVKSLLKAIEREAGRCPEEKGQEIVRLDIDLLMCDEQVFKPADLQRPDVIQGIRSLDIQR